MDKLNKFGYNVTSQHGEDGIIQYILSNVDGIPKTCVEFGAWDGKFLSNTFSLWHDQNWKGILIEGDKQRCDEIKEKYSKFKIQIFNQFITPSGENNIDSLFKNNNIDYNIGVMSIDISSYDYHIWKNMKYLNPYIVIIEHNHTIPGYIDYHDPEGEVFMLCSAKALESLGKTKNYKLICCTLTNSIFIKDSLFDDKIFPDMPVEYLFDYSGCTTPVLSANSGIGNNLIPIFWGIPPKSQKAFFLLKNQILSVLRRKQYKMPSRKVLDEIKEAGLNIY